MCYRARIVAIGSSVAGLMTLKSWPLLGIYPFPINVKLAALLHSVVLNVEEAIGKTGISMVPRLRKIFPPL